MCWRASLPGKTSCSFSSPRTTTAAVTLYFATTSRSYIFRPIRRSSIRKKISGMKSAKKSSRTMHSNPWTPCAPSSSRPSSISSETPSSFAPLPASPISSTHSDVEMVLERMGPVLDREGSALLDHDLVRRDRRRRLGGLHGACNFRPGERRDRPDGGRRSDDRYCGENDHLAHLVSPS